MFVLLALGITMAAARPITSANVVLAIDCGSNQDFHSLRNFTYRRVINNQLLEDQYYSDNSWTADYNRVEEKKESTILYTKDTEVYKSERHGEAFHYDLPIRTEGVYTLVLKFAELHFNETGQRVFDIRVGKRIVLRNFDIIKEAGGSFIAVDKFFVVELTAFEEVYFDDELCEDAYQDQEEIIRVEFLKGKADLPKIDAILVTAGNLTQSEWKEYQFLKSNWTDWLVELEEIKLQKKEQEDLEYWGPPPEPIIYFVLSVKGITLLAVLAFFIWLVVQLDKLPITPDGVDSAKIEAAANTIPPKPATGTNPQKKIAAVSPQKQPKKNKET